MHPNQPPRRHLPDFTDAENEAIIRQVHLNRRRFSIASRGAGSNSMKRALWQEIAHTINLNSSCHRTFTQVKQRHRAMRFEYKKYRNALLNVDLSSQAPPKWKPFMDILEEIYPNGNEDDNDSSSLNATEGEFESNEELDKDPFASTSLNSLDIFANMTQQKPYIEQISLENNSNHLPQPSSTSNNNFHQLINNHEKPSEEVIQVHSSRQISNTTEGQNSRKRKHSEEKEEDLTHEIQLKQLAVLDQQHRNLMLEERLLQTRLNHFARKSRVLNEALLKSLQNDDDI